MNVRKLEKAFIKWHQLFYNYVYLRVRNREVAEDIVQETFTKAFRSKETFDAGKSSLKNWLFKITINALNDYYKGQSYVSLDQDITDEVSLSDDVSKADLVAFVFDKIKLLSDRDQDLLILRYKNDLKIKDIAVILGMKKSATKVAIHRALQKLKDLM